MVGLNLLSHRAWLNLVGLAVFEQYQQRVEREQQRQREQQQRQQR